MQKWCVILTGLNLLKVVLPNAKGHCFYLSCLRSWGFAKAKMHVQYWLLSFMNENSFAVVTEVNFGFYFSFFKIFFLNVLSIKFRRQQWFNGLWYFLAFLFILVVQDIPVSLLSIWCTSNLAQLEIYFPSCSFMQP